MHGRALTQETARISNHVGINANGRAGWHIVFWLGWPEGFAAKISHLSWSIFSLQRGEVHHRSDDLQSGELGAGFDAAFGKGGGPLLGHHLIYGGNLRNAECSN